MEKTTITLTVPALPFTAVQRHWKLWVSIALAIVLALVALLVVIFTQMTSVHNIVLAEELVGDHMVVTPAEYLTENARADQELEYQIVVSNPDAGAHSYRLDIPVPDNTDYRLAESLGGGRYKNLPCPLNFDVGSGDSRSLTILATPQADTQIRVFLGCLIDSKFDMQKMSSWIIRLR